MDQPFQVYSISFLRVMDQENNQPIIQQETPFTVNVKLLSNEVFTFNATPNMPVLQFKRLVALKTNVPVERQRLVFGGKQLVDNSPLSQLLKQSGLTIHLIARAPPVEQPPAQNNNPPQTNPQNLPQNNPTNPPPPFMNFGLPPGLLPPGLLPPGLFPPGVNLSSIFGQPQQNNPNPMNIQIRVLNGVVQQTDNNISPNTQVPPTSQSTSIPSSQSSQQQPNINAPSAPLNPQFLNQLHMSISRLNLPVQQPQPNWNARQQLSLYLRRLQSQMLRVSPILNRSIQLLQQGRINHLRQLVPIFAALNQSNNVAVQAINRLQPQEQPHVHNANCNHPPQQPPQPQQHVHTANCNHSHQHSHQNPPQQQQNRMTQSATVPSQPQNNQPQGQFNVMNALNGLSRPGSGFNFSAIFNQQQAPQNTASQPQTSSQPPQPNNPLSSPPQPQSPAENPQGGVNLMSMLGQMGGSGGFGQILSMSLGDMLQQGTPPSVYSLLLKPINGTELLSIFTQKNFTFINTRKALFRENILKAIQLQGSRQAVVAKMSRDLGNLLVPKQSIQNEQRCREKVMKILSIHIQKTLGLFLNQNTQINIEQPVIATLKAMFCESIDAITSHCPHISVVFDNIKKNVIQEMDKFTPGLSGLFYSIIEKDFHRIYREHEEEKKRRMAMTEEDAENEAQLIQQIEKASADVQYLTEFQHSPHYPNKQ